MKQLKTLVPLAITSVILAAMPFRAMAASPEFARTTEEWVGIRDNQMEYGELEALIQEYNVTVQTNQLDLNEFKKKYGKTKEDVSQKYRDMADEISANLDYPETDDPMYGYMVPSILSAEIQAKNLEKQADDNLEDSEIVYLNYKQAEKTLVTVAQSNMITYWQRQIQLQQAEVQKAQAEIALETAKNQLAIGTGTRVQVLAAEENKMNADRTKESAQTGIQNVRQKLQVMLGWKYNDTPEIISIMQVDMTRIYGMNPQADQERALANNYTLQVNKKKLANAGSEGTRKTLEKTIVDNEQKIGSSLVTNYQNVLAASISYEQAKAELELEQQNHQVAKRKQQQGTISTKQYQETEYAVQLKELGVRDAELALLQTMETYDWAVNGLATAS